MTTPSASPVAYAPRIGTPLSASALRVMLLGSGELGKEVIIALQRLGVEVIAVDRYADAPGHQVAHRAKSLIGISATVEVRDPFTLERVNVGKARRVVDRRHGF